MTPLVSVILPCYNQARSLPDAVGSVLRQAMSDLECVIVNGGSPDDTRETAGRFGATDARVRYIEQHNRGLPGARDRGLQEAVGDHTQFLDSHDLQHPEQLQRQLEALRAQSGLAFFSAKTMMFPDGLVRES